MEQPDTVTLVEWAEKVKAILPKRGVQWVRIQFGKGPNEREIVLSE
ncbi:hypothetical protein HY629_02870 [Candidatus Uhrbacteria bacterium]|nr:hypothetical protein [Candidatus Uhrbacteria bacterium]